VIGTAKEIFSAGLQAVDPYGAVEHYLPCILSTYQRGEFNKLLLISFGKAAFLMTKAIADHLPELITHGIVITKYNHVPDRCFHASIEVYEAGHPIPDGNGLSATRKIIRLVKEADQKTLVLCLISGGGSALLAAPSDTISLEDKQIVTDLLLKAGASIEEINSVRKHISAVKGGRLAALAYPARIISLILSDVVGDRLDVIASGPTTPDSSTFKMALDVVRKYQLVDRFPRTVLKVLYAGGEGRIIDTPREENPIFGNVENIIIGSNRKAAQTAAEKARSLGFEATILSTEIQGEATDAAHWLSIEAARARQSIRNSQGKKLCLISGGETTVTVRGDGKGGRNTELALAFALEIEGIEGITLLSAGTDGTDGPTDAAGAIVDGQSASKGRALGLDPSLSLSNNDSYHFFKKTGELLIMGPTGTNVMDLQIILINA